MLAEVGWHGVTKCNPRETECQLFATPGNVCIIFCCCFIFVAKERSREILVQLDLGLCDILEVQSFFSHTLSI